MSGERGRIQGFLADRALTLLALLGVALAAPAVVAPGPGAGFAVGAALLLAGALAYGTREVAAALATVTLVAYHAATTFVPRVDAAFQTLLAVEAAAAVLPLVAVAALACVLARTTCVEARVPRLLVGMAVTTAAFGTLARLAAVGMLWRPLGDAATIMYALRLDAGASLWAAAGLALAGAALARLLGAGGPPRHLFDRVRARASPLMATMLVVLVVAEGGAITGTMTDAPSDLEIGYHAGDVDAVPADADLVHLEAAWARVESEPGTYNWSYVDDAFARATEQGLDVYFLANTYPPQWFMDERPESVMVDRHGEPFHWIDEAPGTPRERVWDVSFADPVAIEKKQEFLRAAVERYGDHPSVRYVAVQNEPAYPVDWNPLRWASFDPFTVQAFRDALKHRFDGSLVGLNAAYGTTFTTWDDVTPPDHPFGEYGDAWTRFREDLLIAFVKGQVETAKAHTENPVTVKMMAHFFTRFAEPQAGQGDRVYRALADLSDVVSVDLYPVTNADLVRSLRYFHEIADGKPVVVAEFNLAFGLRVPGAGFRLLNALDAMDPYADAVILFTADGHYVYGGVADTPAPAAARLHGVPRASPAFADALQELLAAEAANAAAAPANAVDAASSGLLALRTS